MINKTEQFEKLIERYKLDYPLPGHLRKGIIGRKREIYIAVLKKTGGYGIVIGMISLVFFTLKKAGVGISFMKSAVIAAAASALVLGAAGSGAYLAVKHFVLPVPEDKKIEEKITGITTDQKSEAPAIKDKIDEVKSVHAIKKDNAEIKKTLLLYRQFVSGNVPGDTALAITVRIMKELERIDNKYDIKPVSSADKRKSGMILIGSVEKIENQFVINAKIVDSVTSRILYFSSETAAAEKDIDAKCRAIAHALSGALAGIPGK